MNNWTRHARILWRTYENAGEPKGRKKKKSVELN